MNASTTVSILRTADTNVDEFGDPVDNDSLSASGVPFELHEFDTRESDPTTGEPRVIRFIIGRCYPTVDIQRGDRVRDERSGVTYVVDGVSRPQSPVGTPDPRIELRSLGG